MLFTLDMDLHPCVLSNIVSNVTKSAFRGLLKKQVTFWMQILPMKTNLTGCCNRGQFGVVGNCFIYNSPLDQNICDY